MSQRHKPRGGGSRNRESARNQADVSNYETQDIRPDYERSQTEDARRAEQAEIERAQDLSREQTRNKKLDR